MARSVLFAWGLVFVVAIATRPSPEDAVVAAEKTFRAAIETAAKNYDKALKAAAAKYRRVVEPAAVAEWRTLNFDEAMRASMGVFTCDQYRMGLGGQVGFLVAPGTYELSTSGKVTAKVDVSGDGTFTQRGAGTDPGHKGTWRCESEFLILTWDDGVTLALGLSRVLTAGDVSLRFVLEPPK
jgi:hypothetical protein